MDRWYRLARLRHRRRRHRYRVVVGEWRRREAKGRRQPVVADRPNRPAGVSVEQHFTNVLGFDDFHAERLFFGRVVNRVDERIGRLGVSSTAGLVTALLFFAAVLFAALEQIIDRVFRQIGRGVIVRVSRNQAEFADLFGQARACWPARALASGKRS